MQVSTPLGTISRDALGVSAFGKQGTTFASAAYRAPLNVTGSVRRDLMPSDPSFAAAGPAPAPPAPSAGPSPVLIGAAVVAVGIVAFVLTRKKGKRR